MKMIKFFILGLVLGLTVQAQANEIVVKKMTGDLKQAPLDDAIWKSVKAQSVTLMAQPMIAPRPKTTATSKVDVRAVHNGEWVAFRFEWSDTEKSEAGAVGKFSDAVAVQFPVKEGAPPPVFMGAKDMPVHIFHWRAQYQKDKEKGKPDIKDIYPNMNPDMYPMDFPDSGNVKNLTPDKKELYSHGQAAGNPQSYSKTGVDEIMAEGFGSSAIAGETHAISSAVWNKNRWSVVIARPMKIEQGSSFTPGQSSFAGFAVWQGGQDEVGSRKSVTMSWTPVKFEKE